MANHILHLEDDPEWRDIVTALFTPTYHVHSATTLHIAAELLIEFIEAKQHFSVAIFDISLLEGISNPFRGRQENQDALDWIGDLRAYMQEKAPHLPPLPIIILSGRTEVVQMLQHAPKQHDVISAFDKGSLADETQQFRDGIDEMVKQYEQAVQLNNRRSQQIEPAH